MKFQYLITLGLTSFGGSQIQTTTSIWSSNPAVKVPERNLFKKLCYHTKYLINKLPMGLRQKTTHDVVGIVDHSAQESNLDRFFVKAFLSLLITNYQR